MSGVQLEDFYFQHSSFTPSIAQLVERRTVECATSDILRSLVQIRLEGGNFFFSFFLVRKHNDTLSVAEVA